MADSLRLRDTTVEGGMRAPTVNAPLRADAYVQPLAIQATNSLMANIINYDDDLGDCLLYTSPSPRD